MNIPDRLPTLVFSLYVSTGSPDPEIGDYTLLADLPLPGSS